jgi:hypothetical protein
MSSNLWDLISLADVSSDGNFRLRLGSQGDVELGENGAPFRRLESLNLHNPKAWGAKGDGIHDDTAAIRACVDWAIQFGKGRVELGGGVFKVTDTIHLGYGQTFNSVQFEGQGYLYGGEGGNTGPFNGSAILATFTDRPVFNFQGARGSVLRGVAIRGALGPWIESCGLGQMNTNINPGTGRYYDDTVHTAWDDPALGPNIDSQHAPYAAITIDAYSGPRPAVGYADATYPSWTGITQQYSRPYSSDVLIEDCHITGFTVAIAVQPCDADGNADFTNVRRVTIDHCKWGISIGNTQSRSVAIDDVKFGLGFCALTNVRHGRRSGKFQGFIKNLNVGACTQAFEFGSAYAGPVHFSSFYSEALWRIGDLYASSSNEQAITFDSSIFGFENQNDTRGYPATQLNGPGTAQSVIFRGCYFGNYKSVLPLSQVGVRLENCTFNSQDRDTPTLSSPYLRLAHNATCGGVILPYLGSNGSNSFKWKPFNLDTGAQVSSTLMDRRFNFTSRSFGIPIYAYEYNAAADSAEVLSAPHPLSAYSKDTISSISLSGRTLTLVFPSLTTWQVENFGPGNGDIIWDDASGSTFFVRSVSGTTVTAELQNNYRSNGSGGWETLIPFSATVGNLYFRNSRFYTPTYPLLVDITSGNSTLANAGRDDSYGAFITEVQVGDRLYVDQFKDNFLDITSANVVNAVNAGSPGSIVISGTPTRTHSRKRLALFIRKPPANE